MGWWEDVLTVIAEVVTGGGYKVVEYGLELGQKIDTSLEAPPGTDSADTQARTKRQLQILGAATLALIAAPALYSASSKRKLKESDIRTGIALENASAQATGVLMTALAAPAISTGIAYILVQKLEDAGYVSRGLGNATQGLLTVAAAGPAIQGIGAIVGSAFRKAK